MKTRILIPALLALSFTSLAHADASAILGGAVGGSVGTALAYQRDDYRPYRPAPAPVPVYQPVTYVAPVRYVEPPRYHHWHDDRRDEYRDWHDRGWHGRGWRDGYYRYGD